MCSGHTRLLEVNNTAITIVITTPKMCDTVLVSSWPIIIINIFWFKFKERLPVTHYYTRSSPIIPLADYFKFYPLECSLVWTRKLTIAARQPLQRFVHVLVAQETWRLPLFTSSLQWAVLINPTFRLPPCMVPNPQSSWGLIILNRNHFAVQEESFSFQK